MFLLRAELCVVTCVVSLGGRHVCHEFIQVDFVEFRVKCLYRSGPWTRRAGSWQGSQGGKSEELILLSVFQVQPGGCDGYLSDGTEIPAGSPHSWTTRFAGQSYRLPWTFRIVLSLYIGTSRQGGDRLLDTVNVMSFNGKAFQTLEVDNAFHAAPGAL